MFTPLLLLCSAFVAHAAVTDDFKGSGHIFALKSSDLDTATPSQQVGCLDVNGRFINPNTNADCGVYTRLDVNPYTLSTKAGACSFKDARTELNTDSIYGKTDHAWSCAAGNVAGVYDQLYTVDGFHYPFLCFGDAACYYDAKKVPAKGEKNPLWQYRYDPQQEGITPGHVQLQLLWSKL